jgi:hypothetical protein
MAKNNGGTIKTNGITQRKNFINLMVNSGSEDIFYKSSTVVLDKNTKKALNDGVFSKNTQKPIAKKITKVINTEINDYFVSGALVPSLIKSVKKLQICESTCNDGIRTRKITTAIRNNKYNIFSGKFDEGFPEVQNDIFENDTAALVNRKNTGNLIYKAPINPEIKSYSNKTG